MYGVDTMNPVPEGIGVVLVGTYHRGSYTEPEVKAWSSSGCSHPLEGINKTERPRQRESGSPDKVSTPSKGYPAEESAGVGLHGPHRASDSEAEVKTVRAKTYESRRTYQGFKEGPARLSYPAMELAGVASHHRGSYTESEVKRQSVTSKVPLDTLTGVVTRSSLVPTPFPKPLNPAGGTSRHVVLWKHRGPYSGPEVSEAPALSYSARPDGFTEVRLLDRASRAWTRN